MVELTVMRLILILHEVMGLLDKSPHMVAAMVAMVIPVVVGTVDIMISLMQKPAMQAVLLVLVVVVDIITPAAAMEQVEKIFKEHGHIIGVAAVVAVVLMITHRLVRAAMVIIGI